MERPLSRQAPIAASVVSPVFGKASSAGPFHGFFGRRDRRLHTLGVGLLGAKGRGGIHSGGSSRWQATCGQRDTDDEEGRAGQREWVVTGDAVEQ